MKLKHITLHNYRGFDNVTFYFHPESNVLIGDNGKGKTTVLDAIAVMLGSYFIGSGMDVGQKGIKKDDARISYYSRGGQSYCQPEKDVYIEAVAEFDGGTIAWRREIGDRCGKAQMLRNLGELYRHAIIMVQAGYGKRGIKLRWKSLSINLTHIDIA